MGTHSYGGPFNCDSELTLSLLQHDVLEGVAKRELSLVLANIILTEKLISIDELNNIIACFDYGYVCNVLLFIISLLLRYNLPSMVFSFSDLSLMGLVAACSRH